MRTLMASDKQTRTLDFDTSSSREPHTPPDAGYLVTNHLNLMYMFAAGLVLPSTGFGEKYYRDSLDCAPGWIPLFIGNPHLAAIDSSVADAAHLKPCVVKISLAGLTGPVMLVGPNSLRHRRFPDEVSKAELIFVPAPLPLTAIEKIVFRSAEERKTYEADANEYGNVPWTHFTLRTDKRRFAGSAIEKWPPAHVPPRRDVPLSAVQAAGGMMAILRLMASRRATLLPQGEENLGVLACRLAFDPLSERTEKITSTILADLPTWMDLGRAPDALDSVDEGPQAVWRRLFWQAIDQLVDDQIGVSGGSAKRRLIDFLQNATTGMPDDLQIRIMKLHDDMESLTGLGEFTVSELLNRYKSPLPRALLLLFLRDRCAELLKFEASVLSDEDWLAAAVLFGAREGWLSLPIELRGGPEAIRATSHRMAAMSHRMTSSGINLGQAPARAQPIAERFLQEWDASVEKAALRVARRQRWSHCIRTRVTLGHGDYRLSVTRGGTEIVFQGEPKTIVPEVDQGRFAQCLAEAIRIDPAAEPKLFELAAGK